MSWVGLSIAIFVRACLNYSLLCRGVYRLGDGAREWAKKRDIQTAKSFRAWVQQ